VCISELYKARVRVAQKEGFLEEIGSRNWQIVGPEARYAGWVKIRIITFPLYGASSCTSNTYKISIQKNSFWSRNNSKSLVKICKGFPWKQFCKDVFHLFFCAHIFNSDVLFCNMIPLKVILDWNVLCLGVHHRVL
jgi:hypothetical protein